MLIGICFQPGYAEWDDGFTEVVTVTETRTVVHDNDNCGYPGGYN